MKAHVITLSGDAYSEKVAERCIQSAAKFGLTVNKYYGVDRTHAEKIMAHEKLEWTWANGNKSNAVCPKTGLHQFPYTTNDIRAKIGCSMSHYLLWKYCIEQDETFLILEHDAVFLRPLPEFKFKGICQINDPTGATRKGNWWAQQMRKRGPGVFEKTWVAAPTQRRIPDGLAGNSAYLVKPWAANELVNKFHELGVWPNDAMMCKQLFPYLEEYYPFITKVQQSQSTTIR